MSDLRKCTPESHPDYAGVLRAHEAATKANAFLNESKRDRENYDHVVELEQTQFSDPRKSIAPSKARRLVHEEQIPEAGSANPATSYFFLFNARPCVRARACRCRTDVPRAQDHLVHAEMQRKDAYVVSCVFEAATSFYRFGSPLPGTIALMRVCVCVSVYESSTYAARSCRPAVPHHVLERAKRRSDVLSKRADAHGVARSPLRQRVAHNRDRCGRVPHRGLHAEGGACAPRVAVRRACVRDGAVCVLACVRACRV